MNDEAERIKRELAEYVSREGFTLDQVFTENITCLESAFYVMLDALKRPSRITNSCSVP